MKLTSTETYRGVIEYAKYKAKMFWWKILIMGIMGGAFVAVGYLGYFAMNTIDGKYDSGTEHVLKKIAGAAIFAVGIIMCVFLGGSLFTSDSLSFLPLVEKEMKWSAVAKGLGLVLLGNFIGAILIAFFAWWGGFFGGTVQASGVSAKVELLQHLVHGKQSMSWYTSIGSGILCNIVVAGSVWMSLATKSATGKILLLWFPITLFAAAGFQHIVANFFVFSAGLMVPEAHMHAGEFIYNNLLPTTLGNWIGGAILIPLPYYFLTKFNKA